jgi:hypothetical protein
MMLMKNNEKIREIKKKKPKRNKLKAKHTRSIHINKNALTNKYRNSKKKTSTIC